VRVEVDDLRAQLVEMFKEKDTLQKELESAF
jgi:hypothetical protein